jgi:hypothetical protein
VPQVPPLMPLLPLAWEQVLDQVQDALRQAESAAAAREQVAAASSFARPDDAEHEQAWRQSMQRFEERLRAWENGMQAEERRCADIDTALAGSEQALKEWLEATANIRRNAGKWGKESSMM